ncbi:MAG: sigma-70 family RNA polymerase sigma factor [Planctomycetes bacterium]|nr:sigma-70 family RNA polymerase sigma factor [Planctomycetota bacterium]
MLTPEDLDRQAVALRRLARRLVADADDAEDVAQDAWVLALERPPRCVGALRTWLRRVVRGLATDSFRARSRRSRLEQPLGSECHVRSVAAAGLDLQLAVLEAARALPEPYRAVIWQRYFEGLPPREIAARTGVPVKTIKTRLHRALAMLRERLDAEHGDDRRAWLMPLSWFALPGAGEVAAGLTGTVAPTATPVVASGSFAIGSLLMKTAVLRLCTVALVVIAALAIGWSVLRGSGEPGPGDRAEDGRLRVTDASAPDVRDRTPAAAPAREAVLASPDGGNPLAPGRAESGALVVRVLWDDRSPAPGIGLALRRAMPGLPRVVFAAAVTDETGRARFDELTPGRHVVRTDRGGDVEVDIEAGRLREQELVLESGVDVTGVVVRADGSPAPGASIWLQTMYLDWAGGRVIGAAAADGRFRVRAVPHGRSLGALAPAGGFDAPSPLVDLDVVAVEDGRAELRLELGPPGGRVAGRVVAADSGAALAGVRIAFGKRPRFVDFRGEHVNEQWGLRTVTSDAQGRFGLDGTVAGELAWSASTAGRGIVRGTLTIVAGETVELLVPMPAAAEVHGRIVDAQGGPLAGIGVHAFDAPPGLDFVQGGQIDYDEAFGPVGAITGADGTYRVRKVTPGAVHLVIQAAPDATARGSSGSGRPYVHETIDVPPGADVEWNAVLDEGLVIEGRALYRDGHPLAGQFVSLRTVDGRIGATLVTDDDGRFRFVSLSESLYHVYVQVFDKPRDAPSVELTNVVPGRGPVEIRASFDKPVELEPGEVRGKLLDAGGRLTIPKAATVLLVTATNSWYTSNLDDEGRFHFDHVEPGRLRLVVMDGDTAVHEAEPFELSAAEQRDVGVITTSSAVAVANVVLRRGPGTEEFEPSISLRRDGRSRGATVKPGRHSEVAVGNLEPGEYTWSLYCRGAVSRSGEVTLREDEPAQIEIALTAGATVKFEVRFDPDADLGELTIVYELDGERFGDYTYRPSSALDFRRYYVGRTLPPGEWRAVMTTTTGLTAEARFTIRSVADAPTPVLELR